MSLQCVPHRASELEMFHRIKKKHGGNILSNLQKIIGMFDSSLAMSSFVITVAIRLLKNKLSSVIAFKTLAGSSSRNSIDKPLHEDMTIVTFHSKQPQSLFIHTSTHVRHVTIRKFQFC